MHSFKKHKWQWLLMLLPLITQAQNKPELFVLSVGVSKYENPKYNLSFAHKDAIDLAEVFKNQTELYDVRKVTVLTDEKATRANVRSEFATMKKLISPNDLFVFVFSGHGKSEALITHDYNDEDKIGTSLTKEELNNLMKENISCSFIIMIDACHSAGLTKGLEGKDMNSDFVKEEKVANYNLFKALNDPDKTNIIIGSSKSYEISDECKECQNGYFVQSILDAFEGKIITDPDTKKEYSPDQSKTGFIYINRLVDYLKETVSITTRKNRFPQDVFATQTSGTNFPIAKLLDSDADGVADIYDECKDTKGTVNGCPDDDNDGIANKNDKCPNEKGVKDLAGCPQNDVLKPTPLPFVEPQPNFIKVTKSNAFVKSLVFPGWGDNALNPKTNRIWLGILGYGALAGGFLMQAKSVESYNLYKSSFKQTEISLYRDEASTYNTLSMAFWGVAFSIWAIDGISVLSTKNAKVSLMGNNLGITISLK
jgi:hypothetical protein